MPNVLEAKGISVQFGGLTAVNNLDFEVKSGEILGLIGPNGAGKSTILNCISGTCRMSRGEIWIYDRNICGLKPHEIAIMGVGRTFQIVKPFRGLSVRENVAIGALFGRKRREAHGSMSKALHKADEILEGVDMQDKKDFPISRMTVADRKRLEVARALAMEPKLLLLDEVMAGLNQKEIESMMIFLQGVNARGITILMIEHVMKAIMGICHRVLVLQNGKKIALGKPDEIESNIDVIKAYLGERWVKHREDNNALNCERGN